MSPFRFLEEEEPAPKTWEKIYTSVVIILMFLVLATDKVGTDSVMLTTLVLFMAVEIVDIKEGIAGFANSGILTVLALFMVAEGMTKTGALDWYLGKLLGTPKTPAAAQIRLMIPVCIVSAFLNNTPIVVVMIPIVQRWARNTRMSSKHLLIPLSFATIFGGTCTVIGTSTNLVVTGLYEKRYPDLPPIGMFDLAKYGVPLAMAGIAYILLAAPYLLKDHEHLEDSVQSLNDSPDLLVRARVTKWSPAVGRTVQRSGLRDTGGIYLVSVHRASTGNLHRAVSRDFVLSMGDILYFTGAVETFGAFCEEHGLELVTNEVELALPKGDVKDTNDLPELEMSVEVGVSKQSLMDADFEERSRIINHMVDMIHEAQQPRQFEHTDPLRPTDPTQIVVTVEKELVVVGINTVDRAGLLLDISKGLLRLKLQLHHTEAAVVTGRSVSVWRCETMESQVADLEEIWSVLHSLLCDETGVEVIKQRGIRVIRAKVVPNSRLIGKTAEQSDLRSLYKAAVVCVSRKKHNISTSLSDVRFEAGDILVLQASDGSPLLVPPRPSLTKATSSLKQSLVHVFKGGNASHEEEAHDQEVAASDSDDEVKKDLVVLSSLGQDQSVMEFLTAVTVVPKSNLIGKSVADHGLHQLPEVVLVSIERTSTVNQSENESKVVIASGADEPMSPQRKLLSSTSVVSTNNNTTVTSITIDDALEENDVLWFSGPASSIGDLRRIPGLAMVENDQVLKMNEHVHKRRLVQAVVARQSPLVGKTIKEIKFRTVYGAAVIAVQRGGKRMLEYPGNVKLQAGDLLLLEAGPAFIAKRDKNDRAFTLVAEVKDSAPPRLRMLVPALVITAGMIAAFSIWDDVFLLASLIAAILMVMLGILSEQEARDSINWDVYVTIASAFGIGSALENSGVAKVIAGFLVDIGKAVGLGNAGLYGAVLFACFLASSVLTNNAAAALIFPIGLTAADQAGASPLLMSYAVMIGASDYMTPFGYTTNLLVFAEGGHTFNDFFFFGGPLQVMLWILGTLYLAIEAWYLCWLFTGIALVVIILWRLESWHIITDLFRRKSNASPAS
jgi:di/tricarboxylate transporter